MSDAASGADGERAGPAPVALRRTIGLGGLVLYGLGTTVGAGIYALTGVVAGQAGMLTPAAFLLASALALATALSFSELASRFPFAGGEAVYAREGFGSAWLFTGVGLLAAGAGVTSAATLTVGLVAVVREAFPAVPELALVFAAVGTLAAIAAWGVRMSVVVAGAITLIEVGGLLLVVAFGASHLQELPVRAIEFVPLDMTSLHVTALAVVLCFYAFLGFEDMVNVAEEVKRVERTLPLAIGVTLLVTATLYALVTTISVLAVAPEELAASGSPLALVFTRVGGSAALLGGVAALALINGALIQVVKASRVFYGLAQGGGLPAIFARVHPRTRTPIVATAVVATVVLALAAFLPIRALAEYTASITLLTFTIANLALVRVKRHGPAAAGVFTVPVFVPWLGAGVSAAFLLLEIVQWLR